MVLLNTLENHSTLQSKLFRNLLLPAAVLHVGQPLGFKQWGLYSSATTGNKSISFPISFKTIFAVVLTKGGTYGDSPSFQYLKADNVTTTKFETSTYSTIPTVRWIALGKA